MNGLSPESVELPFWEAEHDFWVSGAPHVTEKEEMETFLDFCLQKYQKARVKDVTCLGLHTSEQMHAPPENLTDFVP